ncbi:MAG: DNA-3-methyladenine glycosylase [Bacteriovoracales bacterium]|nr:DNA-3-methyladenine glycosylase [Bacteriovoracales bacterium]
MKIKGLLLLFKRTTELFQYYYGPALFSFFTQNAIAFDRANSRVKIIMLPSSFFDRDPLDVAPSLLGKLIRFKNGGHWLSALIIETEAYKLEDKASHASLGYTPKRKALFMPPGTIYMYYARGGDSLNISCRGPGNAVLIKSGHTFWDSFCSPKALEMMTENGRTEPSKKKKEPESLCSGQTLLCRSLGIKVKEWDQKSFTPHSFFIEDSPPLRPQKTIVTTRLGIPEGRDEHLFYRFIHYDYARYCTKNPLGRMRRKKTSPRGDKGYKIV